MDTSDSNIAPSLGEYPQSLYISIFIPVSIPSFVLPACSKRHTT